MRCSALLTAGLFGALVGTLPLESRAQESASPRAVSVVATSGTATVHVRPDLAVFTARFDEVGLTPAEAMRRLAARTDSVRTALASLGIARDSILSGSRSDWWRGRIEIVAVAGCRPRSQIGSNGRTCDPVSDTTYRAHEVLEVHIHDLGVVGAALDSIAGRHISEISTVTFARQDASDAQDAALREATESARRQAAAIASAGGATLGRVLSLSTGGAPSRDFGLAGASITSAGSGRTTMRDTQVTRPWIAVTMSVQGRWELVENGAPDSR